MSAEEVIKTETEKQITNIKEKMKKSGYELSHSEETYFRMGIKYGIIIAGLALAKTEID
jgi:hypothetical protein